MAHTYRNGYQPRTREDELTNSDSHTFEWLDTPKWLCSSSPEELTNSDAFTWLPHAKMAHTVTMAVTRQNDELTL